MTSRSTSCRGDARARRLPRRAPAAEGRVRQLPQAGRRATRATWSRARPSGSSRSCCRCSTTSSGRSRRPPSTRRPSSRTASGSSTARSPTLLAREGLAEVETDGRSTRTRRRRCSRSRPRPPREPCIQVLQKGYRLGDRVLRPARVVVSAGAAGRKAMAKSLYESLGVTKNASAGRDQEGLPQARPRGATPTRTRATRRPRRASRRCRPPTTSSPIPRSASSTTASGRANGQPGLRPPT